MHLFAHLASLLSKGLFVQIDGHTPSDSFCERAFRSGWLPSPGRASMKREGETMKRMTKGLLPLLLLLAALLIARDMPREAATRARLVTRADSGIARSEGRTRIDLNRADALLLASIPGIGPKLAGRIEAYVREKGALTAPEELLGVEGIGPEKLKEIEKIAVAG